MVKREIRTVLLENLYDGSSLDQEVSPGIRRATDEGDAAPS